MANQDKKNKNVKKAATKPAKVNGVATLPKYAQNDAAFVAPLVAPKPKKGGK